MSKSKREKTRPSSKRTLLVNQRQNKSMTKKKRCQKKGDKGNGNEEKGQSCLWVMIIVILLLILSIFFYIKGGGINRIMGVSVERRDYVYHQLAIGSQTPVDELFKTQSQDLPADSNQVYLEMLHLTPEDRHYHVGKTGLDHFRETLQRVYSEQTTTMNLEETPDKKLIQDTQIQKIITGSDEAHENLLNFKSSGCEDWECLYQFANTLYGDWDQKKIECDELVMAAVIVKGNEAYLFGRDLDAITGESEKHPAAYVQFVNGKAYYKLASGLDILPEYQNSFWMMSYAYMEQAEQNTEPDDEQYAIIQYYLGNIGYRLLERVGKDDSEFFQDMRNLTVKHLTEARNCLELDISGERYTKEAVMPKEIDRLLASSLLN